MIVFDVQEVPSVHYKLVAGNLSKTIAMNLTLSLSPEESAELQRRADAAGTDVKTFLLHVIYDVDDSAAMTFSDVPYEEWRQTFQEWLSRHQIKKPDMDDSRESIYD